MSECIVYLPYNIQNKNSLCFLDGGKIEIRDCGIFESYWIDYIKDGDDFQKYCVHAEDWHGNELGFVSLDTFIGALIHFFGRDSENVSARIAIKTLEVFKEELFNVNPHAGCVPFFK